MKKWLFLLLILFFCTFAFAETTRHDPIQDPKVPYRLYETTNVWTFIKLDTVTGKMWFIQYDPQGNNRSSTVLSDKNLAENKKEIVGRFTLYPTNNMWNFILIDQYDGGTWQVQWAYDKESRFVLPIK